ncbi:MAG: hypothetical protein QNJ75_06420 [Acidimicrobiia bacterium]|nr:hypothetical protein [Acidimicrobiia bacterium]
MENFWEIALPLLALFGSIILAVVLLARARQSARPKEEEEEKRAYPPSASRRQKKILAQFEPDPEIPTLMDMVRAEIEELGIEEIPGGEGVGGAVLLKVYRRDWKDTWSQDDIEFRVAEGVDPGAAEEDDVVLIGKEGAEPPEDDETGSDSGQGSEAAPPSPPDE